VNDFQKLVLMPGKNERINAFTTILYPIKAIKYNIFKKRNLKLLRLILALDNACMKTKEIRHIWLSLFRICIT